jgi:MerR family mercuric resistance operon transcriptional regulator
MDRQPLRIGALARAAGVGVETIRYYQRVKLLGTPPRPYRGQRLYPPEYADRLRFIKRAQALGFVLDEIAVLLQLNDGTGHARARALAAKRLAAVEAKIADLAAIRGVLRELIRRCEHAEGRVPCPIIASLAPPDRGEGAPAQPLAAGGAG